MVDCNQSNFRNKFNNGHRHSSGTYDEETDTGGSNGAGMRYEAEGGDPANAGLQHARVFLETVRTFNEALLMGADTSGIGKSQASLDNICRFMDVSGRSGDHGDGWTRHRMEGRPNRLCG